MHARNIVRQIVKDCRGGIHPARVRAFTEVVEAATRSKRLTLTALGRAVRCTALVRHRIKKVDRLLGNPKLSRERLRWFKGLTLRVARGQKRLVVLVDWTGYIRIVLGPKPAKAHLRKRYDDYERARATEPWLLATNLENDAAQTIVQLYAQRMKIEEVFGDAKCPRFGWALKYSGSRSLDRLDALLLIAAFAIAVVLLIGAAAAQTGIEKSLRASSKRAPQLSLFSVGCYVLALRIRISFGSVWKQFKRLRRENAALFPKLSPLAPPTETSRCHFPHALFCADRGWNGARYGWPQ